MPMMVSNIPWLAVLIAAVLSTAVPAGAAAPEMAEWSGARAISVHLDRDSTIDWHNPALHPEAMLDDLRMIQALERLAEELRRHLGEEAAQPTPESKTPAGPAQSIQSPEIQLEFEIVPDGMLP